LLELEARRAGMLIGKHFSSPLFSKIHLNILKYFYEKASQIDGKE